jgi:GDPmannose 4,6-dehydratase
MKTALLTGVTGQDGSYLSDFLLEKEYKVIGLYRRTSSNNLHRISHLLHNPNFVLEEFDLTVPSDCNRIISKYKPDEFYNLGAQSHVGTSFSQPTTTFEINTVGVVNVLESIRNLSPQTKFYQASTSEMFGRNYFIKSNGEKYQNEDTSMLPQSPYGISKLASHHMVQIYRSSYNLFTCSAILFNHESPRRGENFVTRKITKYIGKIIRGDITDKLSLGNLDSHRDWGHAKDYVIAMWMMMQKNIPDDFVISSGSTHSVKEFLNQAFLMVGLDPDKYVNIDSSLFRPSEVDYLRGDSTKAKNLLGWTNTISFNDLIEDMVRSDISNA